MVTSACRSIGSDESTDVTTGRLSEIEPKPTIAIGYSVDGVGGLVSAIAVRFIEQQLRYPVSITQFGSDDSLVEALEGGDVDAVVELLVRNSGTIREGENFTYVGDFGSVNLPGWYLVGDKWADRSAQVADLRDPEVLAELTAEAGSQRGTLYSLGDNAGVNQSMVDSLALNLEVTGLESEDELSDVVSNRRSSIIALTDPSLVSDGLDLHPVSDLWGECAQTPGGCGTLTRQLHKYRASSLAAASDEIEGFIDNFSLDQADLNLITVAVSQGASINEAIDDWMRQRHDVWASWVSK